MDQSYRVLIVDDLPEARARWRKALESSRDPSFEVAEATTEDAPSLLEKHDPECLLMSAPTLDDPRLGGLRGGAERRFGLVLVSPEKDGDGIESAPDIERISSDESGRRTVAAVKRNAESARLRRERDDLARQLEHLRSAKCDFLGMISHDIRAPLGVIMGSLTEFGHEEPAEEHHRMLLRLMRRSSQRLLGFADKLLQLSVVESEDFVPQPMRFDFVELTQEVAEQLTTQDEGKGIDVRIEGEPKIEWIGDRGRLSQLISHLISNALRHADATVRIQVEKPGDELLFTITDDGPGMTGDRLERIMLHWEHGDLPNGKRGIGFGLALVRAIAHAHGGRVAAENLPPNEEGKPTGAKFVVALPARSR